MSKTLKRDLIAVIWTLLVTYAIGKWAFHLAYIERGYEAVGGEYLLIPVVYWGAWKAINYLFDSLEELENERNCRKREVEELLGCEITDEQFEEALKYARHKQEYIYQRERRQVVLQHWYLVKLTEEYVRSLAFSKFTMDLCRTLQDMEKEHPIINQSAPTNNHIVAVPAL